MIHAIVLAAGASGRMGAPKALLPIAGSTFVGHILGVLESSGITDITVVLGAGAEDIRPELPLFRGRVVVNERWEEGQLSSLAAGLGIIEDTSSSGALVWPVDRPLVSRATIAALLDAFRKHTSKIVVPCCAGRRGHPVIFPARYFQELLTAQGDAGARQILRDHPEAVLEVETSEEGVLVNIDTPETYRAYVAGRSAAELQHPPAR
jgi:molybdenum cofactor cytidylyltransferase